LTILVRSPADLLRRGAALALLLVASLSPCAQIRDNGPATLVITYKSPAEKRAAFLGVMETAGVQQFERWKKEGVFKDYQLLATSFTAEQVGRFDLAVILEFAAYVDVARWKEIDRRMPGGLSPSALALGVPDTTTVAFPIGRGASRVRNPAKAAYVLGLYEIEVDPATYTKYARGYVEPQLQGWMTEGALSAFAMYQAQPYQRPALSTWTFLLVLEYTDMAALAESDAIKDKVRIRLEKDPSWKAFSDNKASMRKAKGFVFADAILAPPP
jgi:hypothetical protein